MSKIAVVTGGSSGIGLALVEKFAQNGFQVYELSRSGQPFENVTHIDTDVSDFDSVRNAFAKIQQSADHIDVLVNNAGMGISGAVEYTNLSDAKRLFDVNFFGFVAVTQNAIPLLKACKGRIVNVSSARIIRPASRPSMPILWRLPTRSDVLGSPSAS
jgi:NAD(P)-dependent dehydrogenase (short-subunit alcohol dehydrogenase family)